MNFKGLTEKEYIYIQKELKDINLIKKMDELIKKELINTKEIINEEEKKYLINEEDNKKTKNISLLSEEELFKKNIIEISGLKEYEYINNLDYFKGDINTSFNKKYIFNRNFKNFKLFIKNNYESIRKEDFLPIYKLFLQNYKINEDIFKTDTFLEKEKMDNELIDKKKLVNVYIDKIKDEIYRLNSGKNSINEQYINYSTFYNIYKEKRILNNFINDFNVNYYKLNNKLENRLNYWNNFYIKYNDLELEDYKDEIELNNEYEKNYNSSVENFLIDSDRKLNNIINNFIVLRGDKELEDREKIKGKFRKIREEIINTLDNYIINIGKDKKQFENVFLDDLDTLKNIEIRNKMIILKDEIDNYFDNIIKDINDFHTKFLSDIPVIGGTTPFLKENLLSDYLKKTENIENVYFKKVDEIEKIYKNSFSKLKELENELKKKKS